MFTSLPLVDGWHFQPLGAKEFFPYKDYYFPAPPFMFWQAQVSNFFSDQLLFYRVTLIWIPVLFIHSLYSMFRRIGSRFNSALTASLSFLILFGLNFEPVGGWNTQSQMLMLSGFWLTYSAWKNYSKSDDDTISKFNLRTISQLFAGVTLLVFSALLKQTVLLNILVAVMLFSFYVFTVIRPKRRSLFSFLRLSAVLGMLWLVLFTYFLSRNQAVEAFFGDLLSGGGKSNASAKSFLLAIPTFITSQIVQPSIILGIIACAFGFGLRKIVLPDAKFQLWKKDSILWTVIATISLIMLTGTVTFKDFAILAFVVFALNYFQSKLHKLPRIVFYGLAAFVPLILRLVETRFDLFALVESSKVTLDKFILEFSVAAFIFLLYFTFSRRMSKRLESIFGDFRDFLPLATGSALGSIPFGVISSGGGHYGFWFIPLVGIVIVALLERENKSTPRQISNGLPFQKMLSPLVFLSIFLILTSSIAKPYSWWNFQDSPISTTHEVSDFKRAKGLLLGSETLKFYKSIRAKIEFGSKQLKMRQVESPRLFAYPYDNAVFLLSDIEPYRAIRCQSLWFDMCPDKEISKDLERFKSDPPNLIVWHTPTKMAFEVHEGLFVGKKSALRKWEKYKGDMVSLGEWISLGKVYLPNKDTGEFLEVFLKKSKN